MTKMTLLDHAKGIFACTVGVGLFAAVAVPVVCGVLCSMGLAGSNATGPSTFAGSVFFRIPLIVFSAPGILARFALQVIGVNGKGPIEAAAFLSIILFWGSACHILMRVYRRSHQK